MLPNIEYIKILTNGMKQWVENRIKAVDFNDIIVKSSTEGSTKKFKITVDDSGTISATEIVE